MGCFNMTCSVSRLPITVDTPIRAFLLARPHKPDGWLFYPSNYFVPLTTSLKGQYNDYGSIENCPASENFDLGASHFLPGLKDNLDLRTVAESKTALKRYGRELKCDAAVAYVREDVYQAIMNLDYDFHAEQTTTAESIDRQSLFTELEQIRAAIADTRRMETSLKSMNVPMTLSALTMIRMNLSDNRNLKHLALLFAHREGDLLYPALTPYREKLIALVEHSTLDEKTMDLALELANFLHFNKMLHALAILWQPSTNLIGQCAPYDLQHAFNQEVTKIAASAEAALRRRHAEYDDPPDEETGPNPGFTPPSPS